MKGEFDAAMALSRAVAPRLSDEKREACRATLPGLAEAVRACDEFLSDMKSDTSCTPGEIQVAQAMRDMLQAIHEALAEMSGGE